VARPPVQPFPPDTNDRFAKLNQAIEIACNPIVAEMALEFEAQCLDLLPQRFIAVLPTPLAYPLQRTAQAFVGGLRACFENGKIINVNVIVQGKPFP
jgi:hypothetical protein